MRSPRKLRRKLSGWEMTGEEAEIAAALTEASEDVKAGRLHSSAQVREQLESWFGKKYFPPVPVAT